MAKKTLNPSYTCAVPEGAAPCVSDSRFNPDLADGTIEGKVVRKIKQGVLMGQTLPWVGVESRDQFTPANDDAENLNEKDRKYLLESLDEWGIDVPDDATLGELGKAFNRYDPRLAHCFAKYGLKKTIARSFKPKKEEPKKKESPDDAIEKANLKLWLDDHKVPYHHQLGIVKLRALKAEHEARLAK